MAEPAGAFRNSYGDAVDRPFPGTGLRLYVSTMRNELSPSDDVSGVVPVAVPDAAYVCGVVHGRSRAVDPILRGEEMRSIPIIARTSGGAAARGVFEERKRRFGSLSWWQPSPEIELRKAGLQLLDR